MLLQKVQRIQVAPVDTLESVAALLPDPPSTQLPLPTNREKIERCVTYMKTHLEEQLYASQLASIANISMSHFFVLFRHYVGSAPMEFFARLRMRHAAQLLCETDQKVKHIAAAVGYEDQFYFSRQFKLEYELAPSNYRLREATMSRALLRNNAQARPCMRL
jgi:transcriptional regulator GlxA family with amidase domain